MPVKVLMPALSPTMKSGIVAKWHKKEGDPVKPGDVIADIETDKAVMEFEYVDEPGVLHKILKQEGTRDVQVNQVIAVVRVGNEDIGDVEELCKADGTTQIGEPAVEAAEPSPAPAKTSSTTEKTENQLQQPERGVAYPIPDFVGERKVKATPLAKKIASQLSVDITKITGTGPYGRVIKADVLDVAAGSSTGGVVAAGGGDVVEVSSMRRIIAERLLESKQTVPHFYLAVDCMVGELLKLRSEINNNCADRGTKVTVNDFVLKAAALAMREFPEINSSWEGDTIRYHSNISISFAVSIDDGLVTPVIENVDTKSLSEISSITKSLAARAKERKLQLHELQGGGFTVSNLGMFGIREFYAIINPPQSCIMAVGQSEKRAVVVGECVVPADVMTVTLSVDHRVVDGVLAAKFLNRFKFYLENPLLVLV
ncbi:pyruvate dehydrogenase complex dihydrolipoamide acetyltransferase [Anaplasma capra]|uniref:pyruvate dehydrogenase complex dihydrolipoamide acetyltransferase n=1 Tax=Anaplasma capra TaxID=1562740 RepID=UPI0021D5C19A|nr:pyruvate dehydrogenase complex dihydrolipoamide acetyltransferase [Anaplasma capra]MCU7611122.1 pyruvate dehydrogenase complex dihydrolipoamide acetyltransferase [Anaplasma capra]MCU7612374.1 pyruvate dehydrogenase complex dihydrolipoamide acetyltransferase [Anaplasma capra]